MVLENFEDVHLPLFNLEVNNRIINLDAEHRSFIKYYLNERN